MKQIVCPKLNSKVTLQHCMELCKFYSHRKFEGGKVVGVRCSSGDMVGVLVMEETADVSKKENE